MKYINTALYMQTRGGSIHQKYRWYIANIDNSGIVSYQRFPYQFFDIPISYWWQVKYRWFSLHYYYTFPDFLTLIWRQTIIWVKLSIIWQCYIVTSLRAMTHTAINCGNIMAQLSCCVCHGPNCPQWKSRNNTDVTVYFAGDNEICK